MGGLAFMNSPCGFSLKGFLVLDLVEEISSLLHESLESHDLLEKDHGFYFVNLSLVSRNFCKKDILHCLALFHCFSDNLQYELTSKCLRDTRE